MYTSTLCIEVSILQSLRIQASDMLLPHTFDVMEHPMGGNSNSNDLFCVIISLNEESKPFQPIIDFYSVASTTTK